MGNVFKFLFWCIGYRYSEDKTIHNIHDGFDYHTKQVYAHLKNQSKDDGCQDTFLMGKLKQPFLDRWRFFKIVCKYRDNYPFNTPNQP